MSGRFRILLFAILSAFLLSSCTKKKETSTIRLAVPQSLSKVGSLSIMLQHLIINISGPGMPTVKYSWSERSGGSPNLTFPNIPNGDSRLVQVLAIYGEDDEADGTFYYGDNSDSLANVNGGDVPVNITIAQVAAASTISGTIAGRYYALENSSTVFKTGLINVKYPPPNGKPPMFVETAEMYNGWFTVFGLKDIELLYELDGYATPLFGGAKKLSAMSTTASQISRVDMPENWRSFGGGGTIEHEGAGSVLLGKFGEGNTSGPFVPCWDSASYPYQYRFSEDTATTPLSFPTGFSSTDASGCGSIPFVDYIKFRPDLHDNHGKDRVAGMRGPFQTLTATSTEFVTVSGLLASSTVTWKYLPGINSSTIDGVKLFARSENGGGGSGPRDFESQTGDGVNCAGLTSLAQPFTQVATIPITDATNYQKTVNLAAFTNPLVMVCPYKGATLFTSAVEGYSFGSNPNSLNLKIVGSNTAASYAYSSGAGFGTTNWSLLRSHFLNGFYNFAVMAGANKLLSSNEIATAEISVDGGTNWTSVYKTDANFTNGGNVGILPVINASPPQNNLYFAVQTANAANLDLAIKMKITVSNAVKNQYQLNSNVYESGTITLVGTDNCGSPGALAFSNGSSLTPNPFSGMNTDMSTIVKLAFSGCPAVFAPVDYFTFSGSVTPLNCLDYGDFTPDPNDPLAMRISPRDSAGADCGYTTFSFSVISPSNAASDYASTGPITGTIFHSTNKAKVGMLLSKDDASSPGNDRLLLDLFTIGPNKLMNMRSVYLNSDGKVTDGTSAAIPSSGTWMASLAAMWSGAAQVTKFFGLTSAAGASNAMGKISFTDGAGKTGEAGAMVRSAAQNRTILTVSEENIDGGSPLMVLDSGTSLELGFIPSNYGNFLGKNLKVLPLPAAFSTGPTMVKVAVLPSSGSETARIFLAATYGTTTKYAYGLGNNHSESMTVNWATVNIVNNQVLVDMGISTMGSGLGVVLTEDSGVNTAQLANFPTWNGTAWSGSVTLSDAYDLEANTSIDGPLLGFARCANETFIVGLDGGSEFQARQINFNTSPSFITNNIGSNTHLSSTDSFAAGDKVTCHGIENGSGYSARVFFVHTPNNSANQKFLLFESSSNDVCGSGTPDASLSSAGAAFAATGVAHSLGMRSPAGSGVLAAVADSANTKFEFIPLSCGGGTINVGATQVWGSLAQPLSSINGVMRSRDGQSDPYATDVLSIFGQNHQFYKTRFR